MDQTKKVAKEALVKASNSVREKFRALQSARAGTEFHNVEKFKPITGKLDALIVNGRNIKSPYHTYYKTGKYDDISPRYDRDSNRGDKPQHIVDNSDILSLPTIHHENITRKVLNRDKRLSLKRQEFQRLAKEHREQSFQKGRQMDDEIGWNVESLSSDSGSPAREKSSKFKGPMKRDKKHRSSPMQGKKPSMTQKELRELAKLAKEYDRSKKSKPSPISLTTTDDDTSTSDHQTIPSATITTVEMPSTSKNSSTTAIISTKQIPFRKSTKRDAQVQLTSDIDKKKRTSKKKNVDTILISSDTASTQDSSDDDDSEDESSQRMKKGKGLLSPDLMRHYRNKHVSYTYWDNPNELVDRLRLLVASQAAGHTGHVNEISSIVEELREAAVIV